MPTGWGIIGIGNFADRYFAPALNMATDTKIVAVCSRSLERASSFALKHKVERAYDSLDKMLEDPELDVLFVATPNSLHSQHTIQAAEAGKHVLCEKPMALTVPDCELMIEACEKNQVKLGVDFQNRYHPAHIEARRYIRSDEVGEIYMARAQYCRGFHRGYWQGWRRDPSMAGAGALVGTGLHPIDLLRFLLDSEIEEVRALTDEEPPQRPVDDMVYVIITFENGVHGVVISGMIAPRSENDVVLYGSKAKITCQGTVGMWLQGELLVDSDSFNVRTPFSVDEPRPALYVRVVEAFNKCIEENTEPDFSGYNGLQMVRITDAIVQSSRQGRAIKLVKQL